MYDVKRGFYLKCCLFFVPMSKDFAYLFTFFFEVIDVKVQQHELRSISPDFCALPLWKY